MNRIPVGRTLRLAYAFTFGQIGTIIGLIWIPSVINAVGSFFALSSYYQVVATTSQSGVPVMGGPQVGFLFLYVVVAGFLAAMMAVAVTKQALGLRDGPAFAHVALGGVEARVFGAFFSLYILLILFMVVVLLAVVAAAAGAGLLAKTNAAAGSVLGLVAAVAAIAGMCGLFYIFARLGFLFVSCAVNEGEFGLTRSWELTKGNFWRIFAIGMGALVPLLLVVAVIEYFILGPAYFTAQMHAVSDPTNAVRYTGQQAQIMISRMPYLLGLSLIVAPIAQGLIFAPSAFAYRALTGKPKPLPEG